MRRECNGKKKRIQEKRTGVVVIGCAKGVVVPTAKKGTSLSSLLAGGRWITTEGRWVWMLIARIFILAVDVRAQAVGAEGVLSLLRRAWMLISWWVGMQGVAGGKCYISHQQLPNPASIPHQITYHSHFHVVLPPKSSSQRPLSLSPPPSFLHPRSP